MFIIPAIDLKDGSVVRLTQGSFEQQKTYSDSPARIIEQWQVEGAKLIHVVDLDGAKEGVPKNLEALQDLLTIARVPVQFGGGLRSVETAAHVIGLGVKRVIVGTKALDESVLKPLIEQFGDQIVVGIDVRDGKIQTHGWQSEDTSQTVESFCELVESNGVQSVVVTDVSRDGMLSGPNFEFLKSILQTTKMQVTISGGISELSDLEKLSKIEDEHFFGVIIGKALYEQKFQLGDAVTKYQRGVL